MVSASDDDDDAGDGGENDPHGNVRNVVFVVLDTARAASVNERTMPTLSALAAEGTAYDNAFAPAPWTLPSHASTFTGLYPSEHGAHGGYTYLEDDFRTIAEAFDDAGYETLGVSNNTWITEEFGFDRGFDQLRRGWQFVQSDVDMGAVVRGECLAEKIEAARDRLFEGNPVVNAANLLYSEFVRPSGDNGAARATDWIDGWLRDRDGGRPFFLFCNYIEPHVTYEPPREYAAPFLPDDATYEEATAIRQDPRAYDVGDYDLDERDFELLRALYRGELAYVDDAIRDLRAALEAAGEWEDTLFVVCGDHGENVGDHGFFGHQYNLYDTVLRVPLVCHGGAFTGGGRRDDLVSLLDLPETFLEAAGVDDPAFRTQSDGRSFHPGTDADPREAVFAEYVAPQPSIERLEDRFGDVPEDVRAYDRRLRAVKTADYKYVEGDDGYRRAHHVETDPHEERDRSAAEPALVADLREHQEEEFGDLETADRSGEVAMTDSTKDRLADLGYL